MCSMHENDLRFSRAMVDTTAFLRSVSSLHVSVLSLFFWTCQVSSSQNRKHIERRIEVEWNRNEIEMDSNEVEVNVI